MLEMYDYVSDLLPLDETLFLFSLYEIKLMKAYAPLRRVNLELELGKFSEGTLLRNANLLRHKYLFSRVKSTSYPLGHSGDAMIGLLAAYADSCPWRTPLALSSVHFRPQTFHFLDRALVSLSVMRKGKEPWGRECLALRDRAGLA